MDKEDVCSIRGQRERERETLYAWRLMREKEREEEEERASDEALPKPRRYYTCIRKA